MEIGDGDRHVVKDTGQGFWKYGSEREGEVQGKELRQRERDRDCWMKKGWK